MLSKDQALKKISELVERFSDQFSSYKKSDYNETLTRRDFIDPFFKALGWDMDNEEGYAEAYREVIHEAKQKVKEGKSERTKAPDYAFRLSGGKYLFFVEAKRPSVIVKEDIVPAYQVRRYGWSAKLPISIITDFEEFAIYDCTKKPNPTDRASVARLKYITFKEYIKEFDFIWETLSKERVLKGSFDKFVQSDTYKKGTTTVDKEFLQSLDKWRTSLAINIAQRNHSLDEDEINFVVQQTIDRIIFLRIAEDRNVEPYGNLKHVLSQGDYYNNLFHQFNRADEKYNSGLFDFKKDKLSKHLVLDNKIIKSIINELYYPESPYEFSVLSVEILGSAYEQFLGKQIKIDKTHKVQIEAKPEVRKAGGVYYTPQYVVGYIVNKTIGTLINGRSPKEISKIKILDPACGSGSFLIGAFQFLLDYHKDYYIKKRKSLKKSDSPITPDGNLTTAEKKRILTNNIFGVDIDLNAVEVTKLSLLLKCMEGETEASIATQFSLWNERVLPNLDNNIKSGNSLINTDYYATSLEAHDKAIKPFNWKKAFPEIMEEGFDVIIGNPPYVMLQSLELREAFDYALKTYESAKYKIDTYQLFTEASIQLLKPNGLLGFITPNTFLKNIHSEPLRRLLLKNTSLKEFVLFNYSVFADASVDTCIFIIEKKKPSKATKVSVFQVDEPFYPSLLRELQQLSFNNNNRVDFNLSSSEEDSILLEKILSKSEPLGNLCNAYFGIQTFDRASYVSDKKRNNSYELVIDGGNIDTFFLKEPNEYVLYKPEAIKSGGNEEVYRQERICIRQIGAVPVSTIVPANIFTLNTIYNVFPKDGKKVNLKYILGIINSNVCKYFWKKTNSDEKKTFPKIKKEAILNIPIPMIKTEMQKESQKEVINIVSSIMRLKKDLHTSKLQSKKDQIESQIEYAIDKLNDVTFNLYGLKTEEIGLIEKKQILTKRTQN